jgi:hypothetical protein
VTATPVPVNSPRFPASVFAIFDKEIDSPLGTCFAVSEKYLISCQHFMNRQREYRIALVAEKTAKLVTFPKGIHDVKVVKYNSNMDYAILEISDDFDLTPIPLSFAGVEADIDLKVFHFPVTMFSQCSSSSLGPYTCWLKSSISTKHHVPCGGAALYSGSSGAPYVTKCGKAVGFHIESINKCDPLNFEEDMTVDSKLEMVSYTINSNVNSHGSISSALLIGRCLELVRYLNSLGIISVE